MSGTGVGESTEGGSARGPRRGPKFNVPLDEVLSRSPLVLDLASGSRAARKKAQGRITTDILDLPDIDIVCDLSEGLSFLPDDSVDAIYSHNSLEHVPDLVGLMGEIHRVLKPGGRKHVFVPHFTNPYYYSDPTHHNFFGLYTFYYFSDEQDELRRKVPAFYFDRKFRVESLRLRFITHYAKLGRIYRLVERLVNRSRAAQEFYEHSLCYLVPCYGIEATLVAVKDGEAASGP